MPYNSVPEGTIKLTDSRGTHGVMFLAPSFPSGYLDSIDALERSEGWDPVVVERNRNARSQRTIVLQSDEAVHVGLGTGFRPWEIYAGTANSHRGEWARLSNITIPPSKSQFSISGIQREEGYLSIPAEYRYLIERPSIPGEYPDARRVEGVLALLGLSKVDVLSSQVILAYGASSFNTRGLSTLSIPRDANTTDIYYPIGFVVDSSDARWVQYVRITCAQTGSLEGCEALFFAIAGPVNIGSHLSFISSDDYLDVGLIAAIGQPAAALLWDPANVLTDRVWEGNASSIVNAFEAQGVAPGDVALPRLFFDTHVDREEEAPSSNVLQHPYRAPWNVSNERILTGSRIGGLEWLHSMTALGTVTVDSDGNIRYVRDTVSKVRYDGGVVASMLAGEDATTMRGNYIDMVFFPTTQRVDANPLELTQLAIKGKKAGIDYEDDIMIESDGENDAITFSQASRRAADRSYTSLYILSPKEIRDMSDTAYNVNEDGVLTEVRLGIPYSNPDVLTAYINVRKGASLEVESGETVNQVWLRLLTDHPDIGRSGVEGAKAFMQEIAEMADSPATRIQDSDASKEWKEDWIIDEYNGDISRVTDGQKASIEIMQFVQSRDVMVQLYTASLTFGNVGRSRYRLIQS